MNNLLIKGRGEITSCIYLVQEPALSNIISICGQPKTELPGEGLFH